MDPKLLPHDQLDQTISDLLVKFQKVAKRAGYNVRLGGQNLRNRLSLFDDDRKRQIIRRLFVSSRTYEKALENGEITTDSRVITWYLFKEMNWMPAPDLFDKIGKNDVVEVYAPDCCQIFSNLNFFEVISYTLEEVYTYEFPELYSRDKVHIDKLLETVQKVVNENAGTIPTGVGWHTLEERFSSNRHKLRVRHKICSPLYDRSKKISGFVCISDAELISATQSEIDTTH